MYALNRQWLWVTGLSAMLMTIGCQTAKTETKTSQIPSLTPTTAEKIEIPEPIDAKKDAPVAKVVKTMGSFTETENLKTVFFDLNSSKLSEENQTMLLKNVEWLQGNPPMLIQIAGYSDSRGSLIRNKTLAERRALKVKEFYAAHGIPKDRVMVVTMGAEAPTCEKLTEECLAQSRRVETFIESRDIAAK